MKQSKQISEALSHLGTHKMRYENALDHNKTLQAADIAEDFGMVLFNDTDMYKTVLLALQYYYEVTFTGEQESDYESGQ